MSSNPPGGFVHIYWIKFWKCNFFIQNCKYFRIFLTYILLVWQDICHNPVIFKLIRETISRCSEPPYLKRYYIKMNSIVHVFYKREVTCNGPRCIQLDVPLQFSSRDDGTPLDWVVLGPRDLATVCSETWTRLAPSYPGEISR